MLKYIIDHQAAFSDLSSGEKQELFSSFSREFYPSEDSLFLKRCEKVYFVSAGLVKVGYFSGNVRKIVFSYGKNKFFTAVRSFIREEDCIYEFHAVANTELYSITRETLDKLCNKSITFERWRRKMMEIACIELVEEIEKFHFYTPAQRLALLLKESPDIFQMIPKKDVAMLIGITPESLSRLEKRQNKKQGLLPENFQNKDDVLFK